MAQSRDPINNQDGGDHASWELVDAHPDNAANAIIPANIEPNGSGVHQDTCATGPPIDGLPALHARHQPRIVPIFSVEDAAERQKIIDTQTEDTQPPDNAADALILLHAFQSLSDKSGLHSSNAKRIKYFLEGEFVGKPSHTVVKASHELARLSQKYAIADGVRNAVTEFCQNMFGAKDVTDESNGDESGPSQGIHETTGPAHKKQRREKAAKAEPSGKVGGLIRRFMVCSFLALGLVIYLRSVAHEHGEKTLQRRELERASMYLYACEMELKDANYARSSLRVAVQEARLDLEALKKQSRFRLFD